MGEQGMAEHRAAALGPSRVPVNLSVLGDSLVQI